VVRHWHLYLWGWHFLVCTEHYNLKYLLDQCLSTVPQHQWVSKLFDFDFIVEYRPGHLNPWWTRYPTVMPRPRPRTQGQQLPRPSPGRPFTFIDDVRSATAAAPDAQLLLDRLARASWQPRGTRT
jgi:hypothetical protein